MYLFNNLPSFEPACSDTLSCSLYSMEQLIPPDYNDQQPSYHGKSVHALELSLPAYHNQSNFCQNNVDSFHSLLEYDIDNLIFTDPAATFSNELPDIQQSDLDYYVPWDSDNELVEARPAPEPIPPFIPQAFLSVSEPETRNPIPACHWHPDDQKINFSTAPSSPQHLNQTTSYSKIPQTEVFADGNAAIVEGQRKFCNAPPANDACKRQITRNSVRYKDPVYAEYLMNRNREYQRQRRNDPAQSELEREKSRNYQRNRLKDPVNAARNRERSRNYQRERRKDPAYAEYKRQINREYYRKRSQDPAFLERKRIQRRMNNRRRNQNTLNNEKHQKEISDYHAYLAYECELRKATPDQEINIFNQPIQL